MLSFSWNHNDYDIWNKIQYFSLKKSWRLKFKTVLTIFPIMLNELKMCILCVFSDIFYDVKDKRLTWAYIKAFFLSSWVVWLPTHTKSSCFVSKIKTSSRGKNNDNEISKKRMHNSLELMFLIYMCSISLLTRLYLFMLQDTCNIKWAIINLLKNLLHFRIYMIQD